MEHLFSERDRVYMTQALEAAKKAPLNGDVPVGAILVDNQTGKVLATGHNTREAQGSVLGHAELNAIHDGCEILGDWRLADCTLYVTLEPCPMCAGAIINSRIERVVQGALNPKAGSCGSIVDLFALPYNHRPTLESGVLEEECRSVLKEFFKKLRA